MDIQTSYVLSRSYVSDPFVGQIKFSKFTSLSASVVAIVLENQLSF